MPANQKRTKPRRAVILTALRVEYEAVRSHLTDPHEETHKSGTVYERGTLATDDGQPWEVGIVEIGAGNERAAQETDRAITHFRPSIVIFVGVAGGIKDVALGDVVAGTKVYGYESGKAEATFKPRPSVGNSSYNLEQRARAEARKADWLNRLGAFTPELPPSVIVGPIAAGEKVLGSTKSAVWKFIRKSYSDALAVEMEGHGFLQAAFASKVDAIVIRGISDLIEGKFEADAKGWQEIAARHAAAFAFEVLAKLESATSPSSSPAVPPKPKSVEATHAANSPQPNVFPVRNLPYRQNPNFTGREDLLTKLRDALVSGKPAAVVQAIGGLGGVGKTQLALEYAYRHLGDYNVIWWVRAEHATTLASDYASLAGKLGLPGDTIADQNLVVGIVRRWLEKEKNWLLIFDNAAEPSHIEPYLPETVGGHVIITSRHLDWSTLASPLPIETFTPEEALQFLLERTQQHDADAATELAGELGYLPLALEQARAYMESTGRTLADYLELFKAHQLEVLSRGASSSDYPYTVATTWELSFKRVADDSPASVDLLNLCAFLAPEDIPLQVLIDGARFLSEQFATAVQDPFRLDDAVKALLQYSLISRGQDSLAIHRLVRVVVREKMAVEVRRSWVTSAVTLINDAFQFDIDDPKTWPRSARLLSHALTAAQHAEDLQVAGEATGHLLNQTGRYLTTRGEYIDSEREFRRALALRVTVLGENHPDTAESLNDLGWAISKQGNNADARSYYKKALTLRVQLLGPGHPDTAQSLDNLGTLDYELGDYQAARLYHEQALAIREQVLGSNHPDTATSLGNLGTALLEQGNYEGARSYQEQALAIREQVLGSNHPDTAVSLSNLGTVYSLQGNYAKARRYVERAVTIAKVALGDSHPDLAAYLDILGVILVEQGQRIQGRMYLEQALVISRSRLGPDHPTTRKIEANLRWVRVVHGKQRRR